MKVSRLVGRFLIRSHRFPWIRPRGSRPLTVRMDTTNRCNLRCSMCPMRLSDSDPDRVWHDMDPQLFESIAGQIFPRASTVALSCGAEPLMNRSLPDFLRTLYEYDVPSRELVTNGIMLDERSARSILEFPPTSLFVSIDGANPETHAAIRGGADLDTVVENISRLVDLRRSRGKRFPMVSFSVTLQKRNLQELPAIVDLAARVGAVSVNTVLLVPYQGLDMGDQVLDRSSEPVRSTVSEAAGTASSHGILFVCPEEDPDAGSVAGGCPYIDSWVFIDPAGKVNPCPYWNVSEPLGDLSVQSFEEVRTSHGYRSLRTRLSRGELTGNCRVCPEVSCGGTPGEITKVEVD